MTYTAIYYSKKQNKLMNAIINIIKAYVSNNCIWVQQYPGSRKEMYQAVQPRESTLSKLNRNAYLIATISLLNHTMSITYSMMTFKQQSGGFISIIVASLVCFFLSSSHLTIYGISILGILYMKMLEPYYSRSQLHYIVALSGVIVFPVRKIISYSNKIFESFPGRIHASMVFGITLIALVKFFPLAIDNINAFFISANSNALTNPLTIIVLTFTDFNILTLIITIICICGLFLLRNKLTKIPFIAILALIGIIINYNHIFDNYGDLCKYQDVDCQFYIVKLSNMIPPAIEKIVLLLPSAAVMTVILIFEQFLYLQEFQRRGKRYSGEGDLGQTEKQSKTLALSNIISGFLGGLPICINIFATYENFTFNVKSGNKGTKLVGLMQIPISYAFYSFLKPLYQMIPLFVLFVIVATPAIYFLGNMLKIHYRHILFISILAALNVVTHPIIALILAAFISIHDISLMLKSTPAQIILHSMGSRRSSTISKVHQNENAEHEIPKQPQSEFLKRIIYIENDQPEQYDNSSYILYRFTGAVSYLNYFQHVEEINQLLEKFVHQGEVVLMLSFRYSQLIDEESLQELALFIQKLEDGKQVSVIFTGLHRKLLIEMQKVQFFTNMLRRNAKSMYRLDDPSS